MSDGAPKPVKRVGEWTYTPRKTILRVTVGSDGTVRVNGVPVANEVR